MIKDVEIKIIPDILEINMFYDVEEPILKDELLNLLKDSGFKEISEVPEKIEVTGIGPLERITIAKKRGCNINYNSKAGLVGVTGKSFKDVYATFNEFKKIVEENDLLAGVKKVEFNARVKVQVGRKPTSALQLIARTFNGQYLPKDKIDKFRDIFGTDLQPFCIRLYPKDSEEFIGDLRKKDSWLDAYIFPYIPNTKYLAVWIVFRDKDLEKVINFAYNAEKTIRSMVEVVTNDGT